VLDKAKYSAFESTLNSSVVSYRTDICILNHLAVYMIVIAQTWCIVFRLRVTSWYFYQISTAGFDVQLVQLRRRNHRRHRKHRKTSERKWRRSRNVSDFFSSSRFLSCVSWNFIRPTTYVSTQFKVKQSSHHMFLMETRLRTTGCHLPYGITQCYLPQANTPWLNASQ